MLNETDLSRVDLNLLVLFEAVLDTRHVGRGAEQLQLSPSAVSHGLTRLRRLLNDPLFLRTPKGVVPTERALELADKIAEILAGVRSVVATAQPFDPATSTRRFTIGAPDSVLAVFLPVLMAELGAVAPNIGIAAHQLLPPQGGRQPSQLAWDPVLADLDARSIDIAIAPLDDVPARFVECILYEEDFVVGMRKRHPFSEAPTLERYCEMHHLLVSLTGDAYGFVDAALARQGLSRRVALVVPNFMMALGLIAQSDLIAALPRSFVVTHAARFRVVSSEAPLLLPRFKMRAIAPKVALMDGGVAWLFAELEKVAAKLSADWQPPRNRRANRGGNPG
jgi:DNA-binding transcriptional LysR family regulator